jgi:Holliday junction resolvasome RuvABC endonuclease subunit
MDPSMNNTGIVFGIIDKGSKLLFTDWKIFTTKPGDGSIALDTVRRAKKTMHGIKEVIDIYEPKIAFGELPSGSKSSNAMKSYGLSCAYLALLDNLVTVTPTEVKKFVNGTNSASKNDVMALAEELHPYFNFERNGNGDMVKARMEHICDAIIIAETAFKKIINK